MSHTKKTLIQVKNLKKEYYAGEETVVALKNISFNIEQGEICCIFGTSGSGKSTLLNQLAGLEKPTSGEVIIGNIPISRLSENDLAIFRQRYLGFIFQSYNLLGTMTALENTAMPLMFKGVKKEIREKLAADLLKIVGLENRMSHYPREMSGGQQQRVGIARALITKPRIIFADEPTGNLDTKTTYEIMEMISEFAKKYSQTIILVTHQADLAKYATRIITLADGEIIDDRRNP